MRLEDCIRKTQSKGIAALVIKHSIHRHVIRELVNSLDATGLHIAVNKSCNRHGEFPNLYFLDVLAENIKELKHTKNCIGKVHPAGLSQISLSVHNAIDERKIKFLVLDSLSSLLIYNDYISTIKFLRSMTENMHAKGVFTVYLSVAEETEPRLQAQLSQICDHVFRVEHIKTHSPKYITKTLR